MEDGGFRKVGKTGGWNPSTNPATRVSVKPRPVPLDLPARLSSLDVDPRDPSMRRRDRVLLAPWSRSPSMHRSPSKGGRWKPPSLVSFTSAGSPSQPSSPDLLLPAPAAADADGTAAAAFAPAARALAGELVEGEEEKHRLSPQSRERRHAEDRTRTIGELIRRTSGARHRLRGSVDVMVSSSARVRHLLDDVEESLGRAQRGACGVRASVREMLGEAELQKRRPRWAAAAKALRRCGGEQAGAARVAERLLEAFEAGEVEQPVHAACVLLRLLEADGAQSLRVVAATEGAMQQLPRAKVGAVWRATSSHPVSIDAHAVLQSGEPQLRSRFGVVEDAVSLMPLKGRRGDVIGLVICGAPAYPDAFVQSTCEVAGPMIERAWRLERVHSLLLFTCEWAERQPAARRNFAHVHWRAGEPLVAKGCAGFVDEWQPLPHFEGQGLRTWRMELRFRREALGVLEVRTRSNVEVDGEGVELLTALAEIARASCHSVDTAAVGEPPPPLSSLAALDAALDAARPLALPRLHEGLCARLREIDSNALTAELRTYPKPSKPIQRVVSGVLLWLGRPAKALRRWDDIKLQLRPDLVAEMIGAVVTLPPLAQRRESLKATLDVEARTVYAEAPFPVRVLFKWLQTMRLIESIAMARAASQRASRATTPIPTPSHSLPSTPSSTTPANSPPPPARSAPTSPQSKAVEACPPISFSLPVARLVGSQSAAGWSERKAGACEPERLPFMSKATPAPNGQTANVRFRNGVAHDVHTVSDGGMKRSKSSTASQMPSGRDRAAQRLDHVNELTLRAATPPPDILPRMPQPHQSPGIA
ncbi:hypothetical protein AB1Y20_014236 [Prymnesium parvum]|uniref:Uncharacterized protein n=1 Tax=Prymnesium parvum TaxID=97485 RepID=A0AB34IFM2_PRYPA